MALHFVDGMISKGNLPDVVTYTTLIDGLCKKGEIEKAIDLLHDDL
jgi:pentatricopeptide repeat protein